MEAPTIAAKLILAVTLLVAGGAKLASLSSFSATVRMFLPNRFRLPIARAISISVILGELILGTMSLTLPSVPLINQLVLVLCAAFIVISSIGYAIFRGRSCQCFGGLSQRKFDFLGVARSVLLLAMSVIALQHLNPGTIQVQLSSTLLLLVGAALLGASAFIAARAIEASARNLRRG